MRSSTALKRISEKTVGYSKIATLFADYEDLAMFRRFNVINAKNLLYMQAELLHLDQQLDIQIEHDFETDKCEADRVEKYWRALEDSPDGGIGCQQKARVLEIREKLRAYYEALLQTAQINTLAKPQTCDYNYLREWLERPLGGQNFLKGVEADAWRPEHITDLAVPSSSSKDRDRFAQFMSDGIVPWFHRIIGQKFRKPVPESKVCDTWEYEQKIFVVLGNVICMVLSALVPSISIFVLCFLKGMIARLSVITAMSFIFSVIMTFIVQGRRVDVFAATTAFAAVQVVFLGGQNYAPVA